MSITRTLSLALQTPDCLPALCWGDFGIGKTTQILDLAERLGWDTELLRPAERGEGALGVVPVPSEDRKVLHYPLPDWAARLVESGKDALLFLDEVSSTPPALQPSIMGLALDGIIAGQRLPKRIRRIAAANPVDQAAGGWELAPALSNRFVHLDWPSPKADQWTAWLAGQSSSGEVVHLDLDLWEKEYAAARSLGAAFIRSHPSCLHEDVSKVLGRTPPAYATPRTWEAALRLLASCRVANVMDLYPQLAQGCLGPAVALEGTGDGSKGAWLTWLRDNDLPDPEDLLKDPGLFEHDARRPDRTYATLMAVAEAGLATVNGKKLSDKARYERWERAFEVMHRALGMKIGKDVVLLPCRILVDRHGKRRPKSHADPGQATSSQKVGQIMWEFLDLVENRV